MPLTLGLLKTGPSSDQRTPPTNFYSAFAFRLQRMGCSGSAWGWAWDELLFELAGLVLCLAAWAVTGCLPGQEEGGLRKGPLVNR